MRNQTAPTQFVQAAGIRLAYLAMREDRSRSASSRRRVPGNESPSRKLNICRCIPSKIEAISPCVDRLMRMTTKSKCVPGEEQGVELALREVVGNAVIHGNREDPAKRVHIRCRSRKPGALFIAVRDEGNGFSPKQSEKSALGTADSDHGRGILLMRAYMDTVRYSRARSEVYLRKRVREQQAGRVPQTEAPLSTAGSTPERAKGTVLPRRKNSMNPTKQDKNKALVLEAFDTLFNKRDYVAAERYWSPDYIQNSAHISPGREGLFNLIKSIPPTLKYEPGTIVAEGDFVIVHGRFSGFGAPVNWIVADILRIKDGILVEHWDVIQDEATEEQSKSKAPMFGTSFPK